MRDLLTSRLGTCFAICCIYLGMVSSSYAQGATGKTKKSGKAFRVTLFNEWEGPELFLKSKKSYLPLKPHKMAYTKRYRYSTAKPITFYTKQENEKGDEEYLPYLNFTVESSIIEPLIVLYWEPKTKKGGGKTLEFSPKKFGYGNYQFVNLSDQKIFGYIGDKKNRFICNKNTENITNFNLDNGTPIPMELYVTEGNKPDLVFSTMTVHREKRRVILFFNKRKNKQGGLSYASQSLVDFSQE